MAISIQLTLPGKIRKIIMGMPLERLLRSHTNFIGRRFSEDSGDEADFREYQNYVSGEDPRQIDWKVYARSDNRVVKKFSSEKSRNVYLILDCSASMGDAGCRYFLETFYYLCVYLSLKDEIFGVVFLSEKKTQWIKGGTGGDQIRKLKTTLGALSFMGTSQLTNPFLKVVTPLEKKSEIIYFSDLQTPISEINRIAEMVNYQRIHLTLVTAFNHRAYEPLLESQGKGAWLRDEETGIRKFIGQGLVKEYQQEMVNHYRQLQELSRKKNLRYIQIDSQEDGLQGFLKLFQ